MTDQPTAAQCIAALNLGLTPAEVKSADDEYASRMTIRGQKVVGEEAWTKIQSALDEQAEMDAAPAD